MAPIKFEENIKEKLEERRLSPSSDAWSSLANRLDKEERKTKRPFFWWFGIAASIALMVFISSLVFNNGEEGTNNTVPVLVEDETESEKIKQKNAIDIPEASVEVANTEAIKYEAEETPQVISTKKRFNLDAHLKDNLAIEDKVEDVKVNEDQNIKDELVRPKTLEEMTLETVIAEIDKIKAENNNSVTDQQIDSLLKIANKELLNERIFKNVTNVVDADALLRDVEDDLGQSFRTKVYEALKGGYNKVKTAVAERNN